MPINISIEFKAFSKLIDALQSYYGPRLITETAKAQAEARLIARRARIDEQKLLLQGKYELKALEREMEAADTEEIPVFYDPEPVTLTITDNSHSPFEYVERRRLNNIKQITVEAVKALPEHTEVTDQPVNPDWFARFVEHAKDISDKDVQRLWGRLLAGEVAQPGKFSLRTLHTLYNLSSEEARLFERCCQFCTDDGAVLHMGDVPLELHLQDLTRLSECGLLHPPRWVGLSTQDEPGCATEISFGTVSVDFSEPRKHSHVLHMFQLTTAGHALKSLHPHKVDKELLSAFCEAAEKHGLHPRITGDTSGITYVAKTSPAG